MKRAGVAEALLSGLRTYPVVKNRSFDMYIFRIVANLASEDSPNRDKLVEIGACETIAAAMHAHIKRAGTSDVDATTAGMGCDAIHALTHQAGPAILDRLFTVDAAGALTERPWIMPARLFSPCVITRGIGRCCLRQEPAMSLSRH